MVLMTTIFALLLVTGFPVAFAMGISGFVALLVEGTVAPIMIPQKIFLTLNSFTLLAVPLFILSGELMNTGGITRRIVRFSSTLLRQWRGSLAHVNILTSMIMAGFSGSTTADAVSVGGILIPAMVEDGYSPEFSAGVTAASACIGPIIPPSLTMVIYGGITGLSIGSMFLGGIIPGILIGLSQMAVVAYYGRKYHWKNGSKASIRELWSSFREASWALFAPVIILGGIVTGVTTATEAAVVAVVYSLIIGLFVYRELTIKEIPKIFVKCAVNTAIPCIIISLASLFGFVMTRANFGSYLVTTFTSFSSNANVLYFLIILLLLVVGLFVDGTVAMMIFVPLLFPLGTQLGYDPIHFAVVIIITILIGTVTPPVGLQLYIAASIAKVSITKVIIWPFVVVMLLVLLACTYFPPLITFIPNLVLK